MSGEVLFAMYALPCLLNGSGARVPGRSAQNEADLRRHISSDSSKGARPLRLLLGQLFPFAVTEFANWAQIGDHVNTVWPLFRVREYWRHKHLGWTTPSGVIDPVCKVSAVRVKGKHTAVTNPEVFIIECDGLEKLVVDLYGLNPVVGTRIFIHQHVICEVEESCDYLRSIGLDGGENQFGRAESPDSEEIYEQGVRGGEVIRPPELPTVPLASSGQPGEEPASGNPKFGYLFPIPLTRSQPTVHADGEAGEDHEVRVPGFTASPVDGDSVEVGIPTTALPPTKVEHCECGQECKGGHLCPKAPHYGQPRDASDEVVSPGRVVSGRVLADNVVCGTDPLTVEDALFGNHFDGNPS